MRKKLAERQIVVHGIPQRCFDALVDFESYPRWQSAVTACNVISRDRDGRGRRVQFEIETRVRPMSYTVDYSYEQPHLVTWHFVEGDVDDVDGEFVLEDRGDGTTLATCALRIEAGAGLAGNAASVLNDQVTTRSVEDLKARVESGA
jgi:hypothetical protein